MLVPHRSLGALALLAALCVSAGGCVHRLAVDYNFEASGSVVDPSGLPLAGVRVTVEVSADLFEAITPFRQAVETTHEDGSFSFFFLSETPNPPYTLLFERTGFKTVVIEGAIREMNPHRVVLERELAPVPVSPVQDPPPAPKRPSAHLAAAAPASAMHAPPNPGMQRTRYARR